MLVKQVFGESVNEAIGLVERPRQTSDTLLLSRIARGLGKYGAPALAVILLIGGFRAGESAAGTQLSQAGSTIQPAETKPPMPLGAPMLLAPPGEPEGNRAAALPTYGVLPPALERTLGGGSVETDGIVINPLLEIDPETIGILDRRNGGFGPDMWRNSDRADIERLLPRLPGAVTSTALRSLARRLLLTQAEPPRAGLRSHSGNNLLAVRVDRLADLGDVAGLNELLRLVPQRYEDETIARARVEGLLLSGRAKAACNKVRSEASRDHGTHYWHKATVFCQLLSGEVDQAMLGVGLMVEQGTADDPVFFSLIDAYAGADVPALQVATPLHFAMLDATGRPFPPNLIAEASPGLLVALASSQQADTVSRALAGERAVATGVLRPLVLADLYDLFTFDPGALVDPEGEAADLNGPEHRALFYQAVRARATPEEKAELLQAALDQSEAGDHYLTTVRLLMPQLSEIPVRPDLLWFAETAARALYAAGHYGEASEWYNLLRQEAVINPQAAIALTALWPYARLANEPPLAWQGDLGAWRSATDDSSEQQQERHELLRRAFMALGQGGSHSWLDLVGGRNQSSLPRPDPALLYALREASELRRFGETVLLVLLVLGPMGPADSHPVAFVASLSALRQVGLEAEARALAIEAALALGI